MAGHHTASRENIGGLDFTGITVISISYLETSSSSSNLHYLVRRLRRRAPKLPIVVGVWPGGEDEKYDQRIRDVVGADYYTASFKEAVETCVTIARDSQAAAPSEPIARKPFVHQRDELAPSLVKDIIRQAQAGGSAGTSS